MRLISQSKQGLYEQYIYTAAVSQDDTGAKAQMIKFEGDFLPESGTFKYNPLTGTVNFMLSGGLHGQKVTIANNIIQREYYTYLGVFDKDMQLLSLKQVKYDAASEYIRSMTDTAHYFTGIPRGMYTNKYGISFLVTEKTTWENIDRLKKPSTSISDICLTRIDENGEELTAIVIPNLHLMNKYDDQYTSFSYIPAQLDNYLFLNDHCSDFGKSFKERSEKSYTPEKSEAMCYYIDSKDEVHQQYLFGPLVSDESHVLIMESIHYNAAIKTMSALVNVKKGKDAHVCVAWYNLQ